MCRDNYFLSEREFLIICVINVTNIDLYKYPGYLILFPDVVLFDIRIVH